MCARGTNSSRTGLGISSLCTTARCQMARKDGLNEEGCTVPERQAPVRRRRALCHVPCMHIFMFGVSFVCPPQRGTPEMQGRA